MGEGAARVLSRAGRRSAGISGDGGARTYTHAVGVRAYGVVCVPQMGCGDGAGGAICRARGHCLFFCGTKIRKKEDYFMKVGNTFNVNMTGSLSLIRKSVMR